MCDEQGPREDPGKTTRRGIFWDWTRRFKQYPKERVLVVLVKLASRGQELVGLDYSYKK